ncbi:hypothetical protein RI129_002972 [Pyrocoelia pectoralis]|uniref:THAP-type domain-containing protein n=1 Tax=Pyrocoelia pectoralis TaxID=417401 RepID=A0AAN7ZIA8_9COLE
MPYCVVQGCRNYNVKTRGRNIHYFRFPKDPMLCNRWIDICEQERINLSTARICSVHFLQKSFEDVDNNIISKCRLATNVDKRPCLKNKNTGKSTSYIGSKLFNKLPKSIIDLDYKSFKIKVKELLLSKCYYSIRSYLDDTL